MKVHGDSFHFPHLTPVNVTFLTVTILSLSLSLSLFSSLLTPLREVTSAGSVVQCVCELARRVDERTKITVL